MVDLDNLLLEDPEPPKDPNFQKHRRISEEMTTTQPPSRPPDEGGGD